LMAFLVGLSASAIIELIDWCDSLLLSEIFHNEIIAALFAVFLKKSSLM
jgi:hypothetical protein